MEIPWQRLADDVLDSVIEEFVSREGTEYGVEDYTMAEKVAQVRLQLQRGEAMLDFDPDTETCHLIAQR